MVETLVEKTGYASRMDQARSLVSEENVVLTPYDLVDKYAEVTSEWGNHQNWNNFSNWNNWPNH